MVTVRQGAIKGPVSENSLCASVCLSLFLPYKENRKLRLLCEVCVCVRVCVTLQGADVKPGSHVIDPI